jgi:endonuclease G
MPAQLRVGQNLSFIQYANGLGPEIAVHQATLLTGVNRYIYVDTGDTRVSPGAPLFDDDWNFVAMHHTPVPSVDGEGRMLAQDGTIWSGEDISEVAVIAQEAILREALVNALFAFPEAGDRILSDALHVPVSRSRTRAPAAEIATTELISAPAS